MTEKQVAFRDYLLKRLGFEENEFTEEFSEILQRFSFIYKRIGALTQEQFDNHDKQEYYEYIPDIGYVSTSFGIIDVLLWEYRKRMYQSFPFKSQNNNYVSATDLANYVYCPVGFSIANTFELPKSTISEIGTNLHEEHRLVNYNSGQKTFSININGNHIIDETNHSFFDEIRSSMLRFVGHNDFKNQRYFINENEGFIGQPDYIFKNKNGENFVVEEKFQRNTYGNQRRFYNNHKIQLASYINYIQEINLKYGYLVYWVYDDDYNENIGRCYVYRINNGGDVSDYLNNTMATLKTFKKDQKIYFDSDDLSSVKCAKCVHVLLCGHKSKRFDSLSYPYSRDYLRLYDAEYPEILRRD